MKTFVDNKYFELVRRFPLLHIGTDRQLEAALLIVRELGAKHAIGKTTKGEYEYLNALSDLVHKYESSFDFGPTSKMTPIELVGYLMEENGLTQNDMAEFFGSQSRVSEFLNGKRKLTKEQITNLSNRFKLSKAAFF